jgi:hypothetical protein
MALMKDGCASKRKAFAFCWGFFAVTGLALAAVCLPVLGSRAIRIGMFLELAALVGIVVVGYRHTFWGA